MRMRSNFTIVPNSLTRDSNISLKAKGLYAYFASRGDDWKFYIQEIASNCKEGVKAVRSALHELIDNGYVTQKRINGENGHFYYDYEIFDSPQPLSPCTPKGHAVGTVTAQGPTNKKESLKKKERVCDTRSENVDVNTKIVDGWNMMFGVNTKVDNALNNRITNIVSNYSLEDIKKTFVKYHKVYSSDEFYYSIRHSLFEFLGYGDNRFATFYHKDIDSFKVWSNKKEENKMKVMINGKMTAQ